MKTDTRIPVGISSCLLGEAVRFDGGHKRNTFIKDTLGQYFQLLAFCPEVDIGLGVPRQPIRLVAENESVRAVGTRDPSLDVTQRLEQCAEQQREWHAGLCGYILKKDSPSCGMERVKLYQGKGANRSGRGIYANRLMENFPLMPVEEEGRLGDPVLRENFIQRVYVFFRWRRLMAAGLTQASLSQFHARHKLIIMSHEQRAVPRLGRMLAEGSKEPLDRIADGYIRELMPVLKKTATRGNHVNVLQHIQGYLKRQLDSGDRAELVETILQYRQGHLPLIVPITLLRHHFRRQPDPYIEASWYMKPYPQEMQLANLL